MTRLQLARKMQHSAGKLRQLNAKAARPRKPQKPRKGHLIKARVIKAIEGTAGLKTRIAERLGCNVQALNARLRDPDWADVKEVYQEELEKVGDLAEKTIIRTMKARRLDPRTAADAAKWYLARRCRDRGFGDESKVTLEGGDKPIKVTTVPLNTLPIELKRQILKAMEQKEQDEDAGSGQE